MRYTWRAAILLVLIPTVGDAQMSALLRPYEVKPVPGVNFQNSGRILDLMRAGQLYLSLADAIALALENNLDIELVRYRLESRRPISSGPKAADCCVD